MVGCDVKIELPSQASSAIISRWLVRRGDSVQEGKLLARFTLRGGPGAGKEETLRCPVDGTISEILCKEGAGVQEGQVVCRIGDCLHEESYQGICCTCGADVVVQSARTKTGEEREGGARSTTYGMFGSVSHPAFRRSVQSARNQEMERLSTMIKARKLALVLDLDHTLLHTTMPRSPAQHAILEKMCKMSEDVFQLPVNGAMYYTKLRPHLRTFLQELSMIFELYIYTAGDRMYAEKIAALIDHTGRWFSGRIISRDDYPDVRAEHKKLDKIFPFDEHWATAIILDDNAETWNHFIEREGGAKRNSNENLIHIVKYKFWSNDLGETHNPVGEGGSHTDGRGGETAAGAEFVKEKEEDGSAYDPCIASMFASDHRDGQLQQLQRLLTSIHSSFFMLGPALREAAGKGGLAEGQDVRLLLRDEYSSILKGSSLVFSGVFPHGQVARQAYQWVAAEQMGATCSEHISADTTHLVVMLRGEGATDKLMHAVERGDIEVVSQEWVEGCRRAWGREEEEEYRPIKWEVVREETVKAIAKAKESGGGKRKRDEGGEGAGAGGKGKGREEEDMSERLLSEMADLVGHVDTLLGEAGGGGAGGGGNSSGGSRDAGGEVERGLEDDLEDALDGEGDE